MPASVKPFYIASKMILLAAAVCLFSPASKAEQSPDKLPEKIVIAAEHWIGRVHEDGTGLYLDLMRAIYEPLGIKVEYIVEPFKRARMSTINQQTDVFVGTYSQDYRGNDLLLTPRYPIDTERTIAIFHIDSDLTWRQVYQQNREQAPVGTKPYNTAWVIGYNYDYHLGIKKIHELKHFEQGLKMVANKRMDVVIDNIQDLKLTIADKLEEIELLLKWEIIQKRNIFMAFANNPKGAKLCQLFDQQMEKMYARGELKQLFGKWGDHYAMVEFTAPNPHKRKVFCQATVNDNSEVKGVY